MYIAQTTSHDDGKHLTSAKRGGASGVASLDASSLQLDAERPLSVSTHIAAAAPHSGHSIIAVGTYAGNNSVNRAIAHGSARTPLRVLIFANTAGYGLHFAITAALIACSNDTSFAVTAPDATNFYVGNATSYGSSANLTGVSYSFVVLS